MSTGTATAALRLAERGFAVFPLHTPDPRAPKGVNEKGEPTGGCSCRKPTCEHAGKHPRNLNGVTGATTDPEQVRKWWSMFPDANIGLATGRDLPGGGFLAVLDIDPRNDGDASLEELERKHGPLPDTHQVRTGGGGWHYYFTSPEPVRTRPNLAPGVDLKAIGGYVVAPPSLHASGARYEWKV